MTTKTKTKAKTEASGKATANRAPQKDDSEDQEDTETAEPGVSRFSKGRAATKFAKLAKLAADFSTLTTARWGADGPGVPELLEHLSTCSDLLTAGIPLCEALPGIGSTAGALPIDVEDICTWSEKHRDTYSFLGADSFKILAIHGEGKGMRLEIKGKNAEGKTFNAIVLRSHVEKAPE